MTINNDDYDKLMEAKPNLSKFTKRAYLGHYRTLTKNLEKPIRNSSEKQIINVVGEITDNVGSQNALLNMAVLIFQIHDKDYKILYKKREENLKAITRSRVKLNHAKAKHLPSKQELLYHLEDLYKKEDWEGYIINYLLINYNVRNQDLDVLITDKMKDISSGKKGSKVIGKDNFLLVRSGDVSYIRSKYKTFEKYGVKKNNIQSTKFRRALLEFIKEQEGTFPIPLLHKANGNRIADGYLHQYITNKTYDKLGEADYFKIIVNFIDEKGSLNNLRTLSKNRGTSADTIIEHYNLKFEIPPNDAD